MQVDDSERQRMYSEDGEVISSSRETEYSVS